MEKVQLEGDEVKVHSLKGIDETKARLERD
jgi:hypothetical protein